MWRSTDMTNKLYRSQHNDKYIVKVSTDKSFQYRQFYAALHDSEDFEERIRVMCESFVIDYNDIPCLVTNHFFIQRTCDSFTKKRSDAYTRIPDEPMILHKMTAEAVRKLYPNVDRHYMMVRPAMGAGGEDIIVDLLEKYGFQQGGKFLSHLKSHPINQNIFIKVDLLMNTFSKRVDSNHSFVMISDTDEHKLDDFRKSMDDAVSTKQGTKHVERRHRIIANSVDVSVPVYIDDKKRMWMRSLEFPELKTEDVYFELSEINKQSFKYLYRLLENDFKKTRTQFDICKTTQTYDNYEQGRIFITSVALPKDVEVLDVKSDMNFKKISVTLKDKKDRLYERKIVDESSEDTRLVSRP